MQFDGAFSIEHSEGGCSASSTLITCGAMKLGVQNPGHLVDVLFGTNSMSTGQQLQLDFFDQNLNLLLSTVITRG